MVAVTLHFEVVVSAGKVAGLQRVGIALKFGRILHTNLFHMVSYVIWKFKAYGSRALGPFHTERATPALMRGPAQTNFYCFQRSLSHGADAGHRPRTGDMQRELPLGWSRARAREKVLCNIASNGCLHTEREKPALTDSFNDTQWKLAIKTGDKNK